MKMDMYCNGKSTEDNVQQANCGYSANHRLYARYDTDENGGIDR